jgi:transposase
LNKVQAFVGFVYEDVRMRVFDNDRLEIAITVAPHGAIKARCSNCQQPSPGSDRLPERRWAFVPFWGIRTYFVYAPRRVQCGEHGVVVEHIPWRWGKRPVTTAMMGFLARWARRLSWSEAARGFGTSWESVNRSVDWYVEYGLQHRILSGIKAMGLDEIHWGHGMKADNFLTVIYQRKPYLKVIASQAGHAIHVL